MTTEHHRNPPAEESRAARLARLAAQEAAAVQRLLPVAEEVRWDRSTAGRGDRDETGRRATGGHSDPTADTATDPARLHLSDVLARSESYLEGAVVRLRGVRRGIELAVASWAGEDLDEAPPPAA